MEMSACVDSVLDLARREQQHRRRLYGFPGPRTAGSAESGPAERGTSTSPTGRGVLGRRASVPVTRWKPVETAEDGGGVGVVRGGGRAKRVPAPAVVQRAPSLCAEPDAHAPCASPLGSCERQAPVAPSWKQCAEAVTPVGAEAPVDAPPTALEALHEQLRGAVALLVRVGEQVCCCADCCAYSVPVDGRGREREMLVASAVPVTFVLASLRRGSAGSFASGSREALVRPES